ncbi:MAG: 3-dehydroquinate synthase [Candidatus Taylorbacteria bacterium CG11_big_fil_rev_8_21_14_0_20_46_11]|uniref:3-dehydroquinate synthase n=1 Tax=Candidatus Taylorbacteria bacterium CG11_big_fil_rev_8_21_14_0_20_46_11 TaxID=1975025 RepID=A0A2H0KCW2_9BACT|nr:MAG: 3-dehydroquinate synthase [Candidatus Taylorbacteria bacterium CG11_big_fil_rev_8_21_14_0_20_46_11]
MKTIPVQLKKVIDTSYGITVGSGLLLRLPSILKKEHPASSYVIIADTHTAKLFGVSLRTALTKAGSNARLLTVPAGEASKSQKQKTKLEEAMLKAGVDRKGMVLALGGGVVGDLAGFVASTYMRGIPYIQLPTTTLAMLDSAIGGKTGINTAHGKNLLGTFHQPRAVYADVDTLVSLPDKAFRGGLTEALKMCITSDEESFKVFEKRLSAVLAKETKALEEVIARTTRIKAQVVALDEREDGERMILNFGHTIGHAFEKLSNYTISHGEAVAAGIVVETKLAYILGRVSSDDARAIQNTLNRLGLKTTPIIRKFAPKAVVQATVNDKKSVGGHARYVIVTSIGEVSRKSGQCVERVGEKEVEQALEEAGKKTV